MRGSLGQRLAFDLDVRLRAATILLLVLLLAPGALAQVTGPSTRTLPLPVEITAQASFDTGALLAACMAQLAAVGTPPSQEDVNEAARLYFTNGAAATSVPTTGPGAAYFQNGAAVMAMPSSGPAAAYFHNGAATMAYPTAPELTAASESTGEADAAATGSALNQEEDAGLASPVSTTEAPVTPAGSTIGQPIAGPAAEPTPANRPSCSPLEIEAAMAIARQFAIAAPSSQAAPSCPTPVAQQRIEEPTPASTFVVAPRCPPAAALFSRVAAASLSGTFFGGFVVALWLRSRQRRV